MRRYKQKYNNKEIEEIIEKRYNREICLAMNVPVLIQEIIEDYLNNIL